MTVMSAEAIGHRVGRDSPSDNQRVFSPLITAISTKAYPSNRQEWIESIESGLKAAEADGHWLQTYKSCKSENGTWLLGIWTSNGVSFSAWFCFAYE